MKVENNKMFNRESIDFKSLTIGFLFSLCVFMVLGANGSYGEEQNKPAPLKYQISAADEETAYIIEVRSGHHWMRDLKGIVDLGTVEKPINKRTYIDKVGY